MSLWKRFKEELGKTYDQVNTLDGGKSYSTRSSSGPVGYDRIRDTFDPNTQWDYAKRNQKAAQGVQGYQPNMSYDQEQKQIYGVKRPYRNPGQAFFGNTARLINSLAATAVVTPETLRSTVASVTGNNDALNASLKRQKFLNEAAFDPNGGLFGAGTIYDDAKDFETSTPAETDNKVKRSVAGTALEIIPFTKGAGLAANAIYKGLSKGGQIAARSVAGALENTGQDLIEQSFVNSKWNPTQTLTSAGIGVVAPNVGDLAKGTVKVVNKGTEKAQKEVASVGGVKNFFDPTKDNEFMQYRTNYDTYAKAWDKETNPTLRKQIEVGLKQESENMNRRVAELRQNTGTSLGSGPMAGYDAINNAKAKNAENALPNEVKKGQTQQAGSILPTMEELKARQGNVSQAQEIASKYGGKLEDVQRNIDRHGYEATNNMYARKSDSAAFNPDTNQGIRNLDAVVTSELNKQNPNIKVTNKTQPTVKVMSPEEEASLFGTAPVQKPTNTVKVTASEPQPTVKIQGGNQTIVDKVNEPNFVFRQIDDDIYTMRANGATDKEIIQQLKSEGNKDGDIAEALFRTSTDKQPTVKVEEPTPEPNIKVVDGQKIDTTTGEILDTPKQVDETDPFNNFNETSKENLSLAGVDENMLQLIRDKGYSDKQIEKFGDMLYAPHKVIEPHNLIYHVIGLPDNPPQKNVGGISGGEQKIFSNNSAPVSDAPLGKIAEDFYEKRTGDVKIKFKDIEALGKTVSKQADSVFRQIGSDFSTVARKVEEANRNGIKNIDAVQNLNKLEKDLWQKVEDEIDYIRRRASLGRREISEGDQGSTYFPNQTKDAYPTRNSLFEGFRAEKPGNEFKKKGAIDLDEVDFNPNVIGGYITRYADTKLLNEERIFRALQKNNPNTDEKILQEVTQDIVALQDNVNDLSTKVKFGVKKVTATSDGKKVDFVDRVKEIGQKLGKQQTVVDGTPRGITNGDRINSVDITDNGAVHTVGDYLGLNQYRDAQSFAASQVKESLDRASLAQRVKDRLTSTYHLPAEDLDFLVKSVENMKPDLPDEVVTARLTSIYRNAAKAQLMENLQKVDIKNKTLKNDITELVNQIVREGTIERKLSSKIVGSTLKITNALFRKLNLSSALNELSDISGFVNIYGKNTKVFSPDFKLIKEFGLGDIDPAIEPYLKQIENGASINGVLKQLKNLNNGTNFYKFVETYKAGVIAKTAKEFYSNPKNGGLTGDALTKKVLEDYRTLALPVDAFTKTFLDNYPLFTQYMTWGIRNLQKEGRMLTGQIDAGLMKDKTTAARVARNLYANLPAKTVFWLSSNALKGTAIMTAFGLTDFTGLTNQDYSGIAEEDKSWYDKTTRFTNSSTVMSLLNTAIQSWEKEQLKTSDKYANADYNPYKNNNFGGDVAKLGTPQFIKNITGTKDLISKGYSENKDGRVQYEAPTDLAGKFRSYVFGKNQSKEARDYSGRQNIVDRVADGKNPIVAVKDMAAEQLGIKDTEYKNPLNKDYSTAYKEIDKTNQEARSQMLAGGQAYNQYLNDLKKNKPDLYNTYIAALDGNHVQPEYWRNISQDKNGGMDLTVFETIAKRKKQAYMDLDKTYDPIYDLPKEQAAAVLQYMSSPTGTDLALRNVLNKEDWYKVFKENRKAYFDANPSSDSEFTETARVKDWNKLSDNLDSFYYDKEEVKAGKIPQWANDFPLVFQQKYINDVYGFDSDQSKAFFKNNADAYNAQKEEYEKAQLAVINAMRKIEGVPDMSLAALQQANKIADTDGTNNSKKKYSYSSGGGSKYGSKSKNTVAVQEANFGRAKAAPNPTIKVKVSKVKATPKAVKPIAIKRTGKRI